jgi:hypothetical protein
MIGPNVRCAAELVGLAQDVRNAMEWVVVRPWENAAITKNSRRTVVPDGAAVFGQFA